MEVESNVFTSERWIVLQASERRRHICSCHSPVGLRAWEPSAAPMAATGCAGSTSFINLNGKRSRTGVECIIFKGERGMDRKRSSTHHPVVG